MFIDLLLSKFEIFIFFSILSVIIAFVLLFLLQIQNFRSNKSSIIQHAEYLNNTSKGLKVFNCSWKLIRNSKKE